MSSHGHVQARSQVSLRSQAESERWLRIFQESKDAADRVDALEIFGAEPWQQLDSAWLGPAFSAWPKLVNLCHLRLWNIDFRVLGSAEFELLQGSRVEELVMEKTRFEELTNVFRLINSFQAVVALTMLSVKWGDDASTVADTEDDHQEEFALQMNVYCELPALRRFHLRDSSSDTSVTSVLCSMQCGLRLSSLDLFWSDDSTGLNEILQTCGESLREFGVSGIYDAGTYFHFFESFY